MESDELLQYLYEHPKATVALDTETTGLRVYDGQDRAIGLSVTVKDSLGAKHSAYWGVGHRYGENVGKDTLKKIDYVLRRQCRPLIFANVQFDIFAMRTIGIDLVSNPFMDVLTAQCLVAEEWTDFNRGLDELAVYWGVGGKVHEWEYVKTTTVKSKGELVEKPILKTTLKWQKENGWPHTTPEMIFDYACQDTETTYDVADAIRGHAEWKMLPREVWDHKQRTIRALIKMRERGIEINQQLTSELFQEGEAEKARIKDELGMNPASNKDMIELMIHKLGLPILKKSPKTGNPSFDKSVMPDYELMLERDGRQEAKLIRAYRGWTTAVGLLFAPYLKFVSPDGRLRTGYTTHQTVTGRLSAREPNLQQISKDGGQPWNDRVKKCFVAKEGFSLLSVDYSQLELRIGTAYAQEPTLLEVFAEGRDIFTEMTEQLKEQLRKDGSHLAETWDRNKTKTQVYSIQYGGQAKRMQSAFGVTEREGQQLINNFYKSYPRFRGLNNLCIERVKKTGKVKLWNGRYRHFRKKSDARKGMNSLIQGGAADIVEHVLVYAMENIDNPDCQLLLQVHDELVFEVRTELVEHYTEVIKEAMVNVNGICAPGSDEPLFPVTFAAEVKPW